MKLTISEEFITESIRRIEENTVKVKKCLDELTEEEIWRHPNASSNSIGNLIVHLCGNITQYVLSSLGGTPDTRERDLEFSVQGGLSGMELFSKLKITVSKAIEIIEGMDEQQLLLVQSVQGFDLSGLGIILHVTEHYSYHTGQIALLTKLMKNKDLGFYAHLDLNKKNGNNK